MIDLTTKLEKPAPRRSPHWPKVAKAHIAAFPHCIACGRKEEAVAHHKTPVHVDPSLELEPDNLVTLCEGKTLNCHLYFGHLGDWKSWNNSVERDAARFKARVTKRPYKR